MADQLERCLEFRAELTARCASRVERFRLGSAFFHDALPRVWSLNLLLVDRGVEVAAAELAAEADRLQGAAGLRHRRISIFDDDLGEELAPAFRELGWTIEPLLVMPHAWPGRERDSAAIVETDREALESVWQEGMRTEPGAHDEDEVAQVVGQRRVVGAAGNARYFARLVDGRIVSYCELYSDGATAQIEGVLTDEEFRNRGFAGAVVSKALLESRAAGHDLTFLLAEADDWPKELYRKLGFEPAGRTWNFIRSDRKA